MGNVHQPAFLPAPGRERPDFTVFNHPDASLTDGSIEEIEFDQALSLQGRFGRDYLGMQTENVLREMATEHLSLTFADHQQTLRVQLATRTGAFNLSDPEFIAATAWEGVAAAIATGTDAGGSDAMFNPVVERMGDYSEGFLYVAPRLFFRQTNDLDQTLAISDLGTRISSISVRLTFPLFIELLERFADVTLL